MIDVATASRGDFAPYVGKAFRLIAENGECDLLLKEANDSKYSGGKRQPFSLLFSAPYGINVDQGIYVLQNADLGEIDLFLVPVGIEEGRIQLQAVFN